MIYIAKVRRGQKLPAKQSEGCYRHINECIKSHYGLIFNPCAALEWVEGRATIKSASAIAAVVDSAKLKYWFEADYLVYTREILEQCREQAQNIKVPDLPVLQTLSDSTQLRSALGILATQVPDYLEKDQLEKLQKEGQFPTTIPAVSAREWVEQTLYWKQAHLKIYQERVDGFNAALLEDIKRKNEYFNDRQRYQKDWIRRYLKIDRILRAFNPEFDVDSVLDKVDARNCPAVNLYWKVREKRMKSANPPKDTDVGDYMFLPVVPYADIVLTERQLRGFILQADSNLESKVFAKATEAVKTLKNLKCNWQ